MVVWKKLCWIVWIFVWCSMRWEDCIVIVESEDMVVDIVFEFGCGMV